MNKICINGVLGPKREDEYRELEYWTPENYSNKPSFNHYIYTKFWLETPIAYYLKKEEGSRVIITGHIDSDEKFGTVIIVEQLESY